MTTVDTKALRALVAKTVSGDWYRLGLNVAVTYPGHVRPHSVAICRTEYVAEFVTSARTAIPALCDALDEAREKIASQEWHLKANRVAEMAIKVSESIDSAVAKERDALRAEVERLRGLIRDARWSGGGDVTGICPWCEVSKFQNGDHADDCPVLEIVKVTT